MSLRKKGSAAGADALPESAKRAPRLSRRALAARLIPVVNYASQAVERPQDALACLLGARAAITEAINRLSVSE